ncbi:MAG: prepilin-type N-terminal cleavage/methylation domain-containing protein [Candidatus Peribacteria bacterium]|jgi:prepilin-type N-terminal cleavage/methylation domain-containing protein|nr:prepilin-type N-terminal cleavage/methylation domain-containing protein [Candidatus Peribacteria bacterium]
MYKNQIWQSRERSINAFTLTELIVVIIILAILATISFLVISDYVVTTRDAKRQSDITELFRRIDVEYEVNIDDLVNVTST